MCPNTIAQHHHRKGCLIFYENNAHAHLLQLPQASSHGMTTVWLLSQATSEIIKNVKERKNRRSFQRKEQDGRDGRWEWAERRVTERWKIRAVGVTIQMLIFTWVFTGLTGSHSLITVHLAACQHTTYHQFYFFTQPSEKTWRKKLSVENVSHKFQLCHIDCNTLRFMEAYQSWHHAAQILG